MGLQKIEDMIFLMFDKEHFLKSNYLINPHVRLLVGLSVGWLICQGREVAFTCFEMGTIVCLKTTYLFVYFSFIYDKLNILKYVLPIIMF